MHSCLAVLIIAISSFYSVSSRPVLLGEVGGITYTIASEIAIQATSKGLLLGTDIGHNIAKKGIHQGELFGNAFANEMDRTVLKQDPRLMNLQQALGPECYGPVTKFIGCEAGCVMNGVGKASTSLFGMVTGGVGLPFCISMKCADRHMVPCMPRLERIGINELKPLISQVLHQGVFLGGIGANMAVDTGANLGKLGINVGTMGVQTADYGVDAAALAVL